jgi:hypothetical protein
MNALKAALSALTALMVLTGCVSITDGHARVADLSEGYTGPELSTEPPVPSTMFSPGTDLSIGVGQNRVTCTSGWIVHDSGGNYIFTAGQCAHSGFDSPSSVTIAAGSSKRTVTIGVVKAIKPNPDFDPNLLNYAVVPIDNTPETRAVPFQPYPGKRQVSDFMANNAEEFLTIAKDTPVCWFAHVTSFESAKAGKGKYCGIVKSGSGNTVRVSLFKDEKYDPAFAGAPVVWIDTDVPDLDLMPVGIVTDFRDGTVIINVMGGVLRQSGAHLVLPEYEG